MLEHRQQGGPYGVEVARVADAAADRGADRGEPVTQLVRERRLARDLGLARGQLRRLGGRRLAFGFVLGPGAFPRLGLDPALVEVPPHPGLPLVAALDFPFGLLAEGARLGEAACALAVELRPRLGDVEADCLEEREDRAIDVARSIGVRGQSTAPSSRPLQMYVSETLPLRFRWLRGRSG